MSFFQTATENLRWCLTASTMPCRPFKTGDSVEMVTFWNLQRSKFVNHNGAKMYDAWNVSWNVNKLTEARTKMEVGKLRLYTIHVLLFGYELPQCLGDKLEIFLYFNSNEVGDSVRHFVWIHLMVSGLWGFLFLKITVFFLHRGFPQTTLLLGMPQGFYFWGL